MRGLMQDYPLTLVHAFDRAERLFPDKKIVSTTATGLDRTTYAAWAQRTRRLGGALAELGVSDDGRVGTFAWNSARHLELYFAAPCTGRVLHTLNIRLFPEQLVYIANHAEDEVLFVDRSLVAAMWPLAERWKTIRHYVVMDDGAGEIPDDPRIVDYEELVARSEPVDFDVRDEGRAAAMCYTSGTTGNPKGVVYSHRSVFLHSMSVLTADAFAISERDVVMPVVPMFHANAWGLPHACVLAGAAQVFPGPKMTPAHLVDLVERERVTLTAGVPTIWIGVLPAVEGHDVSSLRMIPCGGSAVPKSLSEDFRAAIGIPIAQAWGMTETSPLASIARVKSNLADLPDDALADVRAAQGIPVAGVDARVVDAATGEELPWDGKSFGELQVRGPWIAAEYYDDPRSGESFTPDGWLRTGDVATIDGEGYIRLVDRTKDLVKSGGEWISSVELENEIMGHPKVAEAAVVGVPHSKWQERPLACVVVKEGESLDRDDVLQWLDGRVASWMVPDDVVFLDEIPKTSVGKFSKKTLRDRFAGYRLPTDEGA